MPDHKFEPLGYIVQQHLARSDRPVKGYRAWAERVTQEFHSNVLGEDQPECVNMEEDPYCISTLKHFASLVPIAQTARKPMFDLKQADGISGGHLAAVKRCWDEFDRLTAEIRDRLANQHATAT